MKVIGLMITCNEEWIVKDSVNALLGIAEDVIILDNSNDSTRKKINEVTRRTIGHFGVSISTNVLVLHQEDYPELTNYGEFRQFLLEKGRQYGGTHFVCIDADEMFPENMQNEVKELIEKLPVGAAYQFDVKDFYDDPYHYVDGGKLGPAVVDCIFHDDGKMSYASKAVHEQRTPSGEYIRTHIPILHYGYLNSNKRDIRRKYYMMLEYVNNIASVASINWRYHRWKLKVKKVPVEWLGNYDYASWKQDAGEQFLLKVCELLHTRTYTGLDLGGYFSHYRIVWDRIVDIIRTKDLTVIFKSMKDYIILDVLKKW
jgi:hypothetical protein